MAGVFLELNSHLPKDCLALPSEGNWSQSCARNLKAKNGNAENVGVDDQEKIQQGNGGHAAVTDFSLSNSLAKRPPDGASETASVNRPLAARKAAKNPGDETLLNL